MVDLVPSIRQVHSPGQIRLLPYLLHGVCDPAHRKQGSSDKLVGQEDHHYRKSRQKDEGKPQRHGEAVLRPGDRGNATDIDRTVSLDAVLHVKDIECFLPLPDCAQAVMLKIRLPAKAGGDPSVQKGSVLTVHRQIDPILHVVKIRVHLQISALCFQLLHTALHLFF